MWLLWRSAVEAFLAGAFDTHVDFHGFPGNTVKEHLRLRDLCSVREIHSDEINQDRTPVAGSSWVNEMKAEHERLTTNALILASRKGFTAAARKVAAGYGIQTTSITDINEFDFPVLLNSVSALWTKVLTMSAQKVTATVTAAEDLLRHLSRAALATRCQMRRRLDRKSHRKRPENLCTDGDDSAGEEHRHLGHPAARAEMAGRLCQWRQDPGAMRDSA